jgi:hypothetical protein
MYMLCEKAGFPDVAQNSSLARILASLIAVACCFTLGACSSTLQNSAPGSQSSTQSRQPAISIQATLPGASLGKAYSAVLSVSGGMAPYSFAVNQGELPPGLKLNPQTGDISGEPAQAGTFQFTILVTGRVGSYEVTDQEVPGRFLTSADSGTRAFTLVVGPCVACSNVQISPANPSVPANGRIQFTATVTNTSNPAVAWSANAGTISSSGLFVAPAATKTTTIQIVAVSVVQPADQATTTITVTGSSAANLRIATSSVPSASTGLAYKTSLTITGGNAPYQWTVASGSLPQGLQLNPATGVISGLPTQAGTSTFTVSVRDAAAYSAQQSLTLSVSTAQQCGPPVYCSRTDFAVVPVPPVVPNVGNLTGANRVVIDPDFGNRIARITDWNTDPVLPAIGRSFVSAASGSSNENLWNLNSTLLIISNTGASSYPLTFNPSTMQAARMYVSSYPATGGLRLAGDGDWSHVDPNVVYTYGGTAIDKYDLSDRTNPPSPQLVFDFTSSPHCLPAGFQATWMARGGVSAGDAVFGVSYSNSGGQGTGVYVAAYKAGSGCTLVNTQTGRVTGDWGASGTIAIPDRFTIHSARLSRDGQWMIITRTNCTSSNCQVGPYFWQIGTTNMIPCQAGENCSGHSTEGYSHWVNNMGPGNQLMRSLAQPATAWEITGVLPPGIAAPLDEHPSWNNADPADSLPIFMSSWSQTTPFPAAWYNEITAVAADGSGKVWRFAHNFIATRSQIFGTMYGVGSVSQDGRFFVWSSDWMGTLGSQAGTPTCSIGQDCRGDVFVVELK